MTKIKKKSPIRRLLFLFFEPKKGKSGLAKILMLCYTDGSLNAKEL